MIRRLRLGCRPAVYDPKMPKASSLRMMGQQAPTSVIRSTPLNPQMFGNDKLGDCTAAGMLNHLEAVSALGGFHLPATTNDAVDFYCRSTGYVRGDPRTDRGGFEVSVLKFAARYGVDILNNSYFPIPFTSDPYDFNAMRLAIAFTGAAYLGVDLSISDMNQVEASGSDCVLDLGATGYGDTTPGSEGGHCLLSCAYDGAEDSDIINLITWGTTKVRCTNRWLRSRITEQHGMIWPQLSGPEGVYPTSEPLDNLKADVQNWFTA